ncbi:MAG: helix-turn-helix domain-containing protein [Chloroflexi bacterium]|nr:helix-turn-helix domain-containing protein [Chloroflexota bacterium]
MVEKAFEEYTDLLGAGKFLNVHPDTVRRYIREKRFPASKPFGNKWLINKKDLVRFAQANRRRHKRKPSGKVVR